MFWIDVNNDEIKPPSYRPVLCFCPGWNNSGYQVANYSNKKFEYDEDPNGNFHKYVKEWFVFLEAE